MDDLLPIILPPALEIVSAGVLAAIGYASLRLREKWGIEIEAKHREALHSAIMSGIESALRRNVPAPDIPAVATAYVKRSVPDAVKRLRAGDDVLHDLVEAYRGRK